MKLINMVNIFLLKRRTKRPNIGACSQLIGKYYGNRIFTLSSTTSRSVYHFGRSWVAPFASAAKACFSSVMVPKRADRNYGAVRQN
jgi:hypothetical protein